jgi:hypothetical protein
MNWRKIALWLPLPLLLAGVIYLLIFRQVDLITLALILGALAIAGFAVRGEKKK